jgi:phosphate-selective porin OprO/OprP
LLPAQDGGLKIVPQPILLETPKTPTSTSSSEAAELKARIERLERQNQELMDALKGLQRTPAPISSATDTNSAGLTVNDVRAIINNYFNEKEAQEKIGEGKKVDAGPTQFTVGKSLGVAGAWTNNQLWFETPDKAYRIHVGGRIQPDWVFGAGADNAVISGVGGPGAFKEGFNFRRARLEVDGWMHEVIDFFVEFDFVNQFSTAQPVTINPATGRIVLAPQSDFNTFNAPAPTDVWAGINYIPFVGGVRVGNLKPAIGLDHLTSSRYLDFLERSHGFDTYYNRDNGFAPGFQIFNYTENERVTWQITATKPNNTLFGFSTGGGEWDYCGRITWTPWFEDNGRRMIHLGLGGKYSRLDEGRANLNTRWLLRNGPPNLQNVVAFVNAFGVDQEIINPEFFMNLGPLSVQAEYLGSRVNGVTGFIAPTTGGATVPVPSRTFFSQAAYIQAMYFLTGEHRPYGKTALHGSGAAPTRVVPHRNYFWVPGHSGPNPFSAGAWQVGARYSWTDLNDAGINGGTLNEVTLGLNWFLNPHLKFQWNYDIGHRSLPAPGTSDGYYWGFGMRMAFDF